MMPVGQFQDPTKEAAFQEWLKQQPWYTPDIGQRVNAPAAPAPTTPPVSGADLDFNAVAPWMGGQGASTVPAAPTAPWQGSGATSMASGGKQPFSNPNQPPSPPFGAMTGGQPAPSGGVSTPTPVATPSPAPSGAITWMGLPPTPTPTPTEQLGNPFAGTPFEGMFNPKTGGLDALPPQPPAQPTTPPGQLYMEGVDPETGKSVKIYRTPDNKLFTEDGQPYNPYPGLEPGDVVGQWHDPQTNTWWKEEDEIIGGIATGKTVLNQFSPGPKDKTQEQLDQSRTQAGSNIELQRIQNEEDQRRADEARKAGDTRSANEITATAAENEKNRQLEITLTDKKIAADKETTAARIASEKATSDAADKRAQADRDALALENEKKRVAAIETREDKQAHEAELKRLELAATASENAALRAERIAEAEKNRLAEANKTAKTIELEREKLAQQASQFATQQAQEKQAWEYSHPTRQTPWLAGVLGQAATLSRQDYDRLSPEQKQAFANAIGSGQVQPPWWWSASVAPGGSLGPGPAAQAWQGQTARRQY